MELLIIRQEITCLILLAFFSVYYVMCGQRHKGNTLFLRLSICAIWHLCMAMITVYTVNNMDSVSPVFNDAMHIIYYLSGLLYEVEFFKYVLRVAFEDKKVRVWKYFIYLPVLVYLVMILYLPLEYVKGNGTFYSYGPLVLIAYGISVVISLISLILLIVRWKNVDIKIRYAVVPMCFVVIIFVIVQAFVPEILMTGAGLTLICIAVFFTLDNPISKLKEYAYWDTKINTKNRNCYEMDMNEYRKKFNGKNVRFGVLVADVNYLKTVNDKYGHREGDRLLQAVAKRLNTVFELSEGIYRIGGDEFAIIYIDKPEEYVENKMKDFYKACKQDEKEFKIPLSVAIGFAVKSLENITVDEVVEEADKKMYENKKLMHK